MDGVESRFGSQLGWRGCGGVFGGAARVGRGLGAAAVRPGRVLGLEGLPRPGT